MAQYFECELTKNALLQTVFWQFCPLGYNLGHNLLTSILFHVLIYFLSSPQQVYPSDTTNPGKHMQMQANTSSLPDLSNLSIPSPIHAPIDIEQENSTNKVQQGNNHTAEQPSFQVPYGMPQQRRGVGKQIYSRIGSSNPDVLDTLHREQKPNLNFANVVNNTHDSSNKADSNSASVNTNNSVNHTAPLSPVTPPPYFWNSTPMSPLATGELVQQLSSQAELQQQMSQFQIHSESINNGMGNPPPYPYVRDNNDSGGVNNLNYQYNKQSLYRINSGPAQFNSSHDSKLMCDRQLDSELQKLKAQESVNSELSEADLNSVRVALDPLDFNDVQILSGDNTELVDQSAEESFRLERASYQ